MWRADFEEDLRNGEGGSDYTVIDSKESSGPRMRMFHRDHILYVDLLQGYNHSDGEVSGPSTEFSDAERYMTRKRARRVPGPFSPGNCVLVTTNSVTRMRGSQAG